MKRSPHHLSSPRVTCVLGCAFSTPLSFYSLIFLSSSGLALGLHSQKIRLYSHVTHFKFKLLLRISKFLETHAASEGDFCSVETVRSLARVVWTLEYLCL